MTRPVPSTVRPQSCVGGREMWLMSTVEVSRRLDRHGKLPRPDLRNLRVAVAVVQHCREVGKSDGRAPPSEACNIFES